MTCHKFLVFLILALLWAQTPKPPTNLTAAVAGASMSDFTFVNSAATGTLSSGATSIAVAVTNVQAGDLVVIFAKWESTVGTPSMSDGTSSLTLDPDGVKSHDSGDPKTAMFYLLSSVASGTVTYTLTYGATQTWRDLIAMVYRPSGGTVEFKDSVTGSGIDTSASSGNITTSTKTGVAFAGYGENGTPPSNLAINGAAPDQTRYVAVVCNTVLFSKGYTVGYTGAATLTLDWENRYNLALIAFEITDAGGGYVPYPFSRGARGGQLDRSGGLQ